MKQLRLFTDDEKNNSRSAGVNLNTVKKSFGGSLTIGKRKAKRPLKVNQPLHLILKANYKFVFNPRNHTLIKLIENQAVKFEIKIDQLAVNFSHIHFVIRFSSEDHYKKFIRSLTSLLAIKIRKQYPEFQNIFQLRPYTRVIEWGKDYNNVLHYSLKNIHEAYGVKMYSEKS